MTKLYQKMNRNYKSVDVIFREGDARNGIYLIESGSVRIVKVLKNGQEVELNRVGPKGLFGEMALFDQSNRSATAIAIEDTRVTLITKEMFESQIKSLSPSMLSIIRLLVNRIRVMNDRLVEVIGDATSMEAGDSSSYSGSKNDEISTKDSLG